MSLLFDNQTLSRLSQSKAWLRDESMRFWMGRAEVKQRHKVGFVDLKISVEGTKRGQGW